MTRIDLWGLDRRNYYTKVVSAYLKAFRTLGYAVELVDIDEAQRRLSAGLAPDAAPRAVLDLNFDGNAATVFGEVGTAYVSAIWDVWIQSPRTPPRMAQYRPTGRDYAFSFATNLVEPLKALGVHHAEYLPACCDLETFRPLEPEPAYAAPVSFYATPAIWDQREKGAYGILLKSLEAQRASAPLAGNALAVLEGCFRDQEADLFRYRLPALLQEHEALQSTRLLAVEVTPFKETVLNELSLHFSMLQRREAARLLAPLGLQAWGPEDWREVEGVRYRGPADFHRDLPRLIASSKINLNVPKCHALDAVPPRIFEILACGGFVLTSPIRPLEALFRDGEDLVVFRTREELLEKARYYLDHEDQRRCIAESGMRKARALHGFLPRARRMAEVLAAEGRLGAPAKP